MLKNQYYKKKKKNGRNKTRLNTCIHVSINIQIPYRINKKNMYNSNNVPYLLSDMQIGMLMKNMTQTEF